jgi:hypothetical protein
MSHDAGHVGGGHTGGGHYGGSHHDPGGQPGFTPGSGRGRGPTPTRFILALLFGIARVVVILALSH